MKAQAESTVAATMGLKNELSTGTTNTMSKIKMANWINHGFAFGPKMGSFCIRRSYV